MVIVEIDDGEVSEKRLNKANVKRISNPGDRRKRCRKENEGAEVWWWVVRNEMFRSKKY
jgi:hypothetical protein